MGVHTYFSLERKFLLIEREVGHFLSQWRGGDLAGPLSEDAARAPHACLCSSSSNGGQVTGLHDDSDVSRTAQLLLHLSEAERPICPQ